MMNLRKLAVVVTIAAMGSLTLAPVVRANDNDGDGVVNHKDKCRNSNINLPVTIGSCNTGIFPTPPVDSSGCTINDYIAICAVASPTHKKFRTCVNDLANDLLADDVITQKQKRTIRRCNT